MNEKIGVYICHCGGNISDYVDVAKVKESIQHENGVGIAKTIMFTCADSSQKEMIKDITENGLDAVVVASCSSKLHLETFRSVAERAGLNPYKYVQVNIREQGSWAHSDNPEAATGKVIKLVRAGIARAGQSQSLFPIKIPAVNSAAIIGAGVSGMRSAIALADMGTQVNLIEKDYFAGGRVPQWGEIFSTDEKGVEIIFRLYEEIKKRPNINLFTGAELKSVTGCIGNFKIEIEINPRHVVAEAADDKFQEAMSECPVEIPDEFNFFLTKRKALYKRYRNALPELPAIDINACNRCGKCVEICGDSIDLEQKSEKLRLNSGAILLNTGFDPYEPIEGEYGYGIIDKVITLQQLKRLVELNESELIVNKKKIQNIAFIYCVGSRQVNGPNKYCSRFCCTSAIHTSLLIQKKFKDIRCFHLYRDIRTYGKHEILYEEASRRGDIFLKFNEDEPPVVENLNGNPSISIKDELTENETIEIAPDLVVLVTGAVPRRNDAIADILKVPVGQDKFFNEIHPKLKPVETVNGGIYIAGTCQGPKNIAETMMSSLSASAKTNSLIHSGQIELEPTVAAVDKDACVWCGKCMEVCIYDAIEETKYNDKTAASVNEALCKGCGACSTICHVDAINLIGYTNNEITAMIDAFAREVN